MRRREFLAAAALASPALLGLPPRGDAGGRAAAGPARPATADAEGFVAGAENETHVRHDMNAKREVRDANAERRGAATIAFCGRRPGRRAPWRARTLDAPRRRVRTPSLNRGTPTALDPDGRVVRQVRVAPAAHDACVVR